MVEHLAGGRDRGVEHQRGVVAHVGGGDDAGPRRSAVGVGGVLGAGEEDRRRAVDDARAVARRGGRTRSSRSGYAGDQLERSVVPCSSSGTSAIAANDGASAGERPRSSCWGGGTPRGRARPCRRRGAPVTRLLSKRPSAIAAGGAPLGLERQLVERLPGDALEAWRWRRRRRPGGSGGAGPAGARCRRPSAAGAGPGPRWRRCSDIISQPPAITTSSSPDMIEAAAKFVGVMPDPQKRSRVTPLTPWRRSRRRAAPCGRGRRPACRPACSCPR